MIGGVVTCFIRRMNTSLSKPLAYRDDAASGQPWVVTPEGHDLVRRDRSNGVAQADIARRLGMNASSFRAAMERDDDLRAAYDEGSGMMETELVGLLMQAARDGDRTSAIFLLKGACGFRENTPVAPKADAPAINITIPQPLGQSQIGHCRGWLLERRQNYSSTTSCRLASGKGHVWKNEVYVSVGVHRDRVRNTSKPLLLGYRSPQALIFVPSVITSFSNTWEF